jgi:hypothetical protein
MELMEKWISQLLLLSIENQSTVEETECQIMIENKRKSTVDIRRSLKSQMVIEDKYKMYLIIQELIQGTRLK